MDFDFSSLKLIVGLGNVGDQYKRTRHNAGFMFVDYLLEQLSPGTNWKSEPKISAEVAKVGDLRLLKPTTMMNNSGKSVRAAMDYYQITPEQVLIVHDDLDIPLGKNKLQFSKYPKVHNGLKSIFQHLKSDQSWFLRLGIENREIKGNAQIPGLVYSLKRFAEPEMGAFDLSLSVAASKLLRNHSDEMVE